VALDPNTASTIGRQGLHLPADALADNFKRFGYTFREPQAAALIEENDGYAEPFLRVLGATEIRSFDASNYEQATDIVDFNVTIGGDYRNRFTAVIDGGTLEHVFNFPTAISNCMSMIAPDGHFIGVHPANNFLGHGFYQFSPELFFRVFAPQNGFQLECVIIFEDLWDAEWFQVADPASLGARLTLVNKHPVYLAVIARKIATVPIFLAYPQQSDYYAAWNAPAPASSDSPVGARQVSKERGPLSRLIHRLHRAAPRSVRRALGRRKRALRQASFDNRNFYRPLDEY
jgi:hypothetical protein